MLWVREPSDSETGQTRLYVDGGAGRTDLAEVSRSAMAIAATSARSPATPR
jgi:hypothetical protein